MNLPIYFSAIYNKYLEIKVQKKFNKSFLIPYLNELEVKYNGNFDPVQVQKILNYYGLFITSFLCSSYKQLYGKKLTSEERKRATLFGILTPVVDDMFDVEKSDIESIKAIALNPENSSPESFSSKVSREIHVFEKQNVRYKKEYLEACENLLEIQIETIKQTNPEISPEEIERITYTKGAWSVIIYHQVLDDIADKQMKEVLFLIGSLFQLGNDTFDCYKDVKDNIYTPVTTCVDFVAFKKKFLNILQEMNVKIMDLPYNKKNKKEFCIVINAINARSLVAIDMFIRLQKKIGTKINWHNLDRKSMICDMGKPINIIRWVYYIFRLPLLK